MDCYRDMVFCMANDCAKFAGCYWALLEIDKTQAEEDGMPIAQVREPKKLGCYEGVPNMLDTRLYTENVRSMLGVTTAQAKQVCEKAVADGHFSQGWALTCTGCGRVVETKDEEAREFQETTCSICEEMEGEEFCPSLREKIFYRCINADGLRILSEAVERGDDVRKSDSPSK